MKTSERMLGCPRGALRAMVDRYVIASRRTPKGTKVSLADILAIGTRQRKAAARDRLPAEYRQGSQTAL